MTKVDNDVNIVPSLLDRLLDDDPQVSKEPVTSRIQDLRAYEGAVARDLEELLNSRHETLEELASEFVEVNRSLVTYGLPDLTSLSLLRQMGAEFAAKYPKLASRLLLESDASEDPHVERLIQAFAFLAARVHHKLDDEFPEITEALLNVLYPHYLAPIPSMSIVQFV